MNQYTQDTRKGKSHKTIICQDPTQVFCTLPFWLTFLFWNKIWKCDLYWRPNFLVLLILWQGRALLWPATWDEGALKGREGDQRSQIWATHYSAIFSFRESFSRTGIQPKQRETSTKSLWLPKRVYFIICHVVLYLRWMWTEFNWCINRGWSSIGCHRLLRVLS